jgi:UDP-N-acetylmuramoyl-tripeptide--D-alanyl-D-alanine ligase
MTELDVPLAQFPHWTAHELAIATGGIWHFASALDQPRLYDLNIARIISNTRQIQHHDAFLALVGERFDAHDFVADAIKQGATVAIVSHLVPDVGIPQLLVDDTRLALGRLAAVRRRSFPTLTTLALTGSSGKTTTKEMLGSILRLHSHPDQVLVTRGNLNNDLGVPMMLLELTPQHRFAVLELGANHIGEIAYTTAMVQPKVAGILNIGTAHVGEFGGRAGIATAKSEIFQGLAAEGIAIIPAQGDFSEVICDAAQTFKCIRFGGHAQNSDVYANQIQISSTSSQFILNTQSDSISIELPLAGAHNIENALAAAAFALALDVPLATIAQGLNQAQNTKGRLNFIHHTLPNGSLTLIDDTYNANPHSMRAAAQVLTAQTGMRILVLGDIGELGDSAAQEHRDLGRALAMMPLDAVFVVGQYAEDVVADIVPTSIYAQAFANKQQLFVTLKNWLHTHLAKQPYQINILFKGSRFTQMETLINAFETEINLDLIKFESSILKNDLIENDLIENDLIENHINQDPVSETH